MGGGVGSWLRPVAVLVLLALTAPSAAWAVQPDEVLADANLEKRARSLSAGLRCLVCQNQSIDDSDAPLAKDLRVLVRERLVAGDTDAQVVDYVVARYGDFVLLKPPMNTHTVLLWATPLLILGLVAAFLARGMRRQRGGGVASAPPLSAVEEKELEKVLKDSGGTNSKSN